VLPKDSVALRIGYIEEKRQEGGHRPRPARVGEKENLNARLNGNIYMINKSTLG